MKNTSVATVRTTTQSFWVAIVALVVSKVFGWEINLSDPLVIAAIPVVTVLVYRVSILLQRVDLLAWLLFGIARNPQYAPEVKTPIDNGNV